MKALRALATIALLLLPACAEKPRPAEIRVLDKDAQETFRAFADSAIRRIDSSVAPLGYRVNWILDSTWAIDRVTADDLAERKFVAGMVFSVLGDTAQDPFDEYDIELLFGSLGGRRWALLTRRGYATTFRASLERGFDERTPFPIEAAILGAFDARVDAGVWNVIRADSGPPSSR